MCEDYVARTKRERAQVLGDHKVRWWQDALGKYTIRRSLTSTLSKSGSHWKVLSRRISYETSVFKKITLDVALRTDYKGVRIWD